MNTPLSPNSDNLERITQLSSAARLWLSQQLNALTQTEMANENRAYSSTKLIACIGLRDSALVSVDELKQHCKLHLPSHMQPQEIRLVDSFPHLENGKIDRRKLTSFVWQYVDEEVDLLEDFVAPRNALEQTLATIWQEVLGIDEVSVHDDFFEVGGDSLLSIRILARAHKQGLSITAAEFFENPTVAEQAELARREHNGTSITADISAELGMLPIQHWFFERITAERHYWNQSVLLSCSEQLQITGLEPALRALLLRHAGLRANFQQRSEQWVQVIQPLPTTLPLSIHVVAEHELGNIEQIAEQKVNELSEAMCFKEGMLIGCCLLKTPEGQENKLLVVMHHLIVDAQSWRIIIDELPMLWRDPTALDKVITGTPIHQWVSRLQAYSKSAQIASEIPFWSKIASAKVPSFPTDYTDLSGQHNQNSFTQTEVLSLEQQDTEKLIRELPRRFQTDINSVLLTALSNVIAQWTQSSHVLIDVEGHGRDAIFTDMDVSATVGWLTTVYPVWLELQTEQPVVKQLMAVKSQLKAIPNKGLGFGILKELHPYSPIRDIPRAQICFNYLGQIDRLQNPSVDVSIAAQNIGMTRSPQGNRAYTMEINSYISQQQLRVEWSYNRKIHSRSSIKVLASRMLENIHTICHAQPVDENSPSSGTATNYVGIEDDELAKISALLNQLDNND